MKFNICTNTDNGVGLEADYKLLKGLLESWGHQVHGVHFKKQPQIEECPRVDVNIFLEVLQYDVMKKAKENWLIPNPEWFVPCDHQAGLPQITKILCKTHEAERIFSELYGAERVVYIGFESKDLYDAGVERKRVFLHVAGQSRYKNSPAVAYAFAKCFDDPDPKDRRELIFVGAYPEEVQFARDHKNVRYIQRASDSEMKKLMNECLFHIMPSGTEGWGHVIHEGLGCGAIVITTDYPPMNEFGGLSKDLFAKHQRVIPELAAQRAMVGAFEVKAAIDKAWSLSAEKIAEMSSNARAAFLAQRERFRTCLRNVVDGKE